MKNEKLYETAKSRIAYWDEFDGACEELVTEKIIPMALETPDYEDDDERDDIAETCALTTEIRELVRDWLEARGFKFAPPNTENY